MDRIAPPARPASRAAYRAASRGEWLHYYINTSSTNLLSAFSGVKAYRYVGADAPVRPPDQSFPIIAGKLSISEYQRRFVGRFDKIIFINYRLWHWKLFWK